MDRPYRLAISTQAALNILEDEARLGLIDGDMVQIFIESRIYEQVWTIPQVAQQVI
jgi:HD-GYP domain-containing protein (c-di-GMP phosphodiesterase class II)